jgi:cation diffusion facilitator family transporter
MVVEIAAGWWFNSMALLADGWHMSSHALAIGLSAWAYAAARRYARDARFAFGTWKIEILGGYTSALLLLVVAALMVVGSLERLWNPQPIAFQEAVAVATLGLVVNIVCAWILGRAGDHGHHHGHHHHHDHDHDHDHDHSDHPHRLAEHIHHHHSAHHHHHDHADLNLRSAYLHVVADAATSVLAIVALLGGWFYGWTWLDPVMGLVGAALVALWSRGLIRQTSRVLLDCEMDHPIVGKIAQSVLGPDASALQIADLHVWRVGKEAYACAMTLDTTNPDLTAQVIRQRLLVHDAVVHITVEVRPVQQLAPSAL